MKTNASSIIRWWPVCLGALVLLSARWLIAGAEPKTPPATTKPPATVDPRAEELKRAERNFRRLLGEFDRINEEVRRKWDEVNKLREELQVTERESDGSPAGAPAPDTVRILETQLLDSDIKRRELETLYAELGKMSRKDLKNALPTAAPDPVLASLLQNEATAQQTLVAKLVDRGDQHPEVRSAQRVLDVIQQSIDERLEGIMRGMKTRLEAGQAAIHQLREQLAKTKAMAVERAIAINPYLIAKRDLETLQQVRDRLQVKVYQERIDMALLEAR